MLVGDVNIDYHKTKNQVSGLSMNILDVRMWYLKYAHATDCVRDNFVYAILFLILWLIVEGDDLTSNTADVQQQSLLTSTQRPYYLDLLMIKPRINLMTDRSFFMLAKAWSCKKSTIWVRCHTPLNNRRPKTGVFVYICFRI